jgi:putative transcriptional regulator
MAASLFEDLEPVSVSDSQLDIVMSRLDEDAPLTYPKESKGGQSSTPAILQRLMQGDFSDLTWKKITSSLRISYLTTGDPYYEFALYHIKAGGVIPEHNHRGSEMTLVLEGGFSDSDGTYHAGDFLFREAGDVHSPAALADEDCICLAVLDAPLKFTRMRHRWMNPFLQLKAS